MGKQSVEEFIQKCCDLFNGRIVMTRYTEWEPLKLRQWLKANKKNEKHKKSKKK